MDLDFRKWTLINSSNRIPLDTTIGIEEFDIGGKWMWLGIAQVWSKVIWDTWVLGTELGSDSFMIECMIRTWPDITSDQYMFMMPRWLSSTFMSLILGAGKIQWYFANDIWGVTTGDIVSTTTIQPLTDYHFLYTRDWTDIKLYINGVMEASATGAGQSPSSSYNIVIWGLQGTGANCIEPWFMYYRATIHSIDTDIAWLYNEFLRSSNIAPPKRGFRDTSVKIDADEAGLVAWYQFAGVNANKTLDVKGALNLTISGTPQLINDWLNFIAANTDKAVAGNVGNTKSIHMRVKLGSTSESILEWAANDKLIYANAGTLTYAEFDNAFINGVDSNTVVADQWHDIVITSSTNVDMSAVSLALNNVTYGDIEIAFIKFYTKELVLADAVKLNNDYARQVVLLEDFEGNGADWVAKNQLGWTISSGTSSTTEQSTDDTVLRSMPRWEKIQTCITAGIRGIPNEQAYGTFELLGLSQTGVPNVNFITDSLIPKYNFNGYGLIWSGNTFLIRRMDGDGVSTNTMASMNGFSGASKYDLKITRTLAGVTTVYARGGDFGSEYVMPAVAAGSNPFTDNTHKTTKYITVDNDTGDAVAGLKVTKWVAI